MFFVRVQFQNLNILVEDDEITGDEKSLFKLDSILNAVGVEGEEEVMAVLKKHDEQDPSKTKDSLLKIIRSHIEQQKKTKLMAADPFAAMMAPPSSNAAQKGKQKISKRQDSRKGKARQTLEEQMREWEAMTESVRSMLMDKEKIDTYEAIKRYHRGLTKIVAMEEKSAKLDRVIQEMTIVKNKLGGE